jgi:antitoxin YefM
MIREYKYDEAMEKFSFLFYQTINDRVPIKIRNEDGKSIYLVSEEDYSSIMETFYLLQNPANAKHLMDSLKDTGGVKFESLEALKNETGV